MRVVLSQINPVTGDLKSNTARVGDEISRAKERKADLVVFPETVITGYCISDLIEQDSFVYANKAALLSLAPRTKGVAAVVGFVDYDPSRRNEDGRLRKYNAAAVFCNGELVGVAYKTLLPNYRYFDDKRYYAPAERREPVPVRLGSEDTRLGVSICEDMWDDDYGTKPIRELAERGSDLVVNINASPFVPGKLQKRDALIRRHVSETGLPFVYVNTVGAADNGKNIIPFDGRSLAYGTEGLVGVAKAFEEDSLLVDLGCTRRTSLPASREEEELYEALVMGLGDYAKKTGFTRAIEPVSGGIDSALGLAICAEAFGPENVTAYNMPSRFNSMTTMSIAQRTAQNLGVEYRVLPIEELSDGVQKTFEKHVRKIRNGASRENVQARLRGLLMMLESNDTGALLVSNGNETEIALGYSTLYGDMCGGISVIGDLSKTDVYRLAEYANARHGREVIPREAFEIRPSAELSEGQFDPFDYDVTAPLVGEFAERRADPEELVRMFSERRLDGSRFLPDREGRSVYDKHTEESFRELVYDTYRKMKGSVYKRLQGPPIIAVSERAFGFDLRETIINGWDGR